MYLISECGKTKTKATAVTNHNQLNDAMNQWELKENTRNPRQARENARDHVAITLIGWAVDASF